MDETFASDICDGPDQIVPEAATSSFYAFNDHDYHPQIQQGASLRSGSGTGRSSGGIQFPSS